MRVNGAIIHITFKQTALSSAGLEHVPSKHRVGGSNPSGQATYGERGEIGRHKGLKIPRYYGIPVRVRAFAPGSSSSHAWGGGWPQQGEVMARSKKTEAQAELRTETIEEFLERGGKIQKIPYGVRSVDANDQQGWKGPKRKKKTN